MSDQSALEDSWDRERKLVERIAALEEVKKKYQELLYCVENKFPEETRHETAKRYIMEREKPNNQATQQAI